MKEMFLSVYLILNKCVAKEIYVTKKVFIRHYWRIRKDS